ncbi:hypothetical protein PVK06_027903 [Gossypium arboreum]|uniref:Uncharacterized protein n=1 Tax=Gossypium arboreum TaxID=29729 RepID=A0ABR0P1I9_GOSAR|nr:hypothetical protein PVK06_027903 [Gossypium arboreum]
MDDDVVYEKPYVFPAKSVVLLGKHDELDDQILNIPTEEVVHDVPHSYDEGHYTIDDHVVLNGEVQQEIGLEITMKI